MMSSQPHILIIQPLMSQLDVKLSQHFHCHRLYDEQDTALFLQRQGGEIQGIVTRGDVGVETAIPERLPACKAIAVFGVGTDRIDLNYSIGEFAGLFFKGKNADNGKNLFSGIRGFSYILRNKIYIVIAISVGERCYDVAIHSGAIHDNTKDCDYWRRRHRFSGGARISRAGCTGHDF